ncbi:MAG: hypothetical protein P9M00_06065 [Candidatus Tritonobacter lacicola]|nr:hypothetical protein [Candidatus Tritonobacter lacicola]
MTLRSRSLVISSLICLAFILTRLAILNSEPLYRGFPMRIQPDIEEFYVSNIAIELINGPILPLTSYPDRPYEGYLIVDGILAVPFFLALGPSYFALKLTALTVGLATLIALFYLALREFGLRTAAGAALLYVLAPPGMVRLSLWALGHYPQSQLFLVLSLVLVYRICLPRSGGPVRLPDAALLGLLSGFCLFFHPICVIFPVYCLLVFAIFRRDFFRIRPVSLFLLAAVLGSGILPLKNYWNLQEHVHFAGKTAFLSSANLQNIMHRATVLFGRFFAQIWHYEDISSSLGTILNYAFYFSILLAYFFLLIKSIRSRTRPSKNMRDGDKKIAITLLFPPVLIIAYCLSNFIQPFNSASVRFILPIYPVVCLIVPLFILGLAQSKKSLVKCAAWCMGAVLLAVNVMGILNLTSARPSRFRDMDTYWGWIVGQHMARKYMEDRADAAFEKIMATRRGETQKQVIRGFADAVAEIYFQRGPTEFQDKVRSIDKKFRPDIYMALGRFIYHRLRPEVKKCSTVYGEIPSAVRRYCYEGLGRELGYQLVVKVTDPGPEEMRQFSDALEDVPHQYKNDCYRGLGSVAVWEYDPPTHIRMRRNEELFETVMSCVDPEYRSSLEEGKDIGYYRFPEW